ncbi:MAG: hypothetical protein ACYC9S_12620 [Leptospirales bacterium]
MNHFQGFDDQNKGSGIVGILVGSLAGIGAFVGSEWAWWRMGWGPWIWSGPAGRSETIHAFWLAFFGHLNPSYSGDLGTWVSFASWLKSRHEYDAFVASFWIPFLIGAIVGLLSGLLVSGTINKKGAAYVRGSRIN